MMFTLIPATASASTWSWSSNWTNWMISSSFCFFHGRHGRVLLIWSNRSCCRRLQLQQFSPVTLTETSSSFNSKVQITFSFSSSLSVVSCALISPSFLHPLDSLNWWLIPSVVPQFQLPPVHKAPPAFSSSAIPSTLNMTGSPQTLPTPAEFLQRPRPRQSKHDRDSFRLKWLQRILSRRPPQISPGAFPSASHAPAASAYFINFGIGTTILLFSKLIPKRNTLIKGSKLKWLFKHYTGIWG